jgi:hypothetical protein
VKPTKIKNYASKVISSAKQAADKAKEVGTEIDSRFPEGNKVGKRTTPKGIPLEGDRYTAGSLKEVGAAQRAQVKAEQQYSGSKSGRDNVVTPATTDAIDARDAATRAYKPKGK